MIKTRKNKGGWKQSVKSSVSFAALRDLWGKYASLSKSNKSFDFH